MPRAKLIALMALRLLAGAILLLAAMDCFTPGLMDAQTMQCCASMPCTPTNQSHDCCKSMVRAPAVYLVPPATASAAPLLAAVSVAPPAITGPSPFAQRLGGPLDTSAHAPPQELYTVHHSLLI